MNKKIVLGIVLCAVSISFCGCSWAKSFSEDDTKTVATYSAKIIAKYNKNQKDGIVEVTEEDKAKVAGDDLKALEALAQANNSANTTSSKSKSSSSSNSTAETKPAVSLSSALGISGVDFTYLGNEVRDNYTSTVYDMSPTSGYKFLVMKFRVTNNSGANTEVNILSKNPKFKATLNGTVSANNDMSLMDNDLATYKGTLNAGESKELVLLFQFKNEDLANIQSTSLQCTVAGSTSDITL